MKSESEDYLQGDLAFTRESPYGTVAEPTWSGATSFMRRRYTRDLTGVDVAVFGVPFDLATSNRPGARFGPRAIRAASTGLAWERVWPWQFDAFDRLNVIDYGDCVFDPGRPEEIVARIESFVAQIVTAQVLPLALGGDHFISFPVLKALHRQHGPMALIHFDAHSDTWRDDEGRIDHGTMFFHAARLGLIDPSSSIQLGMRTVNSETHGFEVLDARCLHSEGPQAAVQRIRERVGDRPCYVTVDVDFLDPSFAPGTGTPVCGGFSTATAIELLTGLEGLRVVGADVVEVAPAYDHAEVTALAAATLAAHQIYLMAASSPGKGQ